MSAGRCRGCVRGPGAAVDVDASGGSNTLAAIFAVVSCSA